MSPKGGGGEVVFYDLAKGMAKRGHEVHVVCNKIVDMPEESLAGVILHRIEPSINMEKDYFFSMSKQLLSVLHSMVSGFRILRNSRFDVIHANTISPVIAGSLLGKIFHVPVVRTVHDVYSAVSSDYWKQWAQQKSVSSLSALFAPFLERIVLRLPVAATHAISETTKNDLLSLNLGRGIVVIPNGLDLEYAPIMPATSHNYDSYVVYIGRLISTKNVEIAISALELVVKNMPNAKFVVVGDGPMRETWENSAKDKNLDSNIIFTGFVDQPKKYELLKNCSALLFPSVVEGFGLVILEAFSMCKPVLASNIKPLDEIVDDGINGYLLDPFAVKAWAERVLQILSNPKLCQRMGLAGRQKLEEKYSFCHVLEKMEQLYMRLADKKKE